MGIIVGILYGLRLGLQGSICLCVEVDLELSSGEDNGPASSYPPGVCGLLFTQVLVSSTNPNSTQLI